jgi:hypothetical protein
MDYKFSFSFHINSGKNILDISFNNLLNIIDFQNNSDYQFFEHESWTQFGIPGYSIEAIVVGMLISITIVVLIKRKNVHARGV